MQELRRITVVVRGPSSDPPDSGPGDTGAAIDGTAGTDSGTTDGGVTCDLSAPCDAPAGYQCWFVSADATGPGTGPLEDPFGTVQQAIDAMNGGDFVYLRGGTYPEVVAIPLGKDGTSTDPACADGSWSTIRSYPGEWAVLDGGHTGYTIGRSTNGSGSGTLPDGTWGGLQDIHYWKLEHLPSGIKHKNDQVLAARTGTDWRYEEMGDDIHHNIFLDEVRPISAVQDFAQVHHNIMRGGSLHISTSHSVPEMIHVAAYNNLIIEGNLQMYIPYYDPDIIVDFHPYVYMANNIVEGFAKKWDSPSIALGVGMNMDDAGMGTVDLSDALLDRNYVYNPVDPEHFRVGRNAGACSDWLSTDGANTGYGTQNYTSNVDASDLLHVDDTEAGRFKTRSAHALGAGTTIGTGGHGGAHPHIDGVTLPANVGPCEDDACVWVDEVLRLRTLGADYRPAGCE